MVKVTELKTKDNKPLVTKEGVQMKDYSFEPKDEFIPQHNSLLSKTNKAIINGKEKTITTNKLKVIVKDFNNEEPIFVTLTPAQARSLTKKISEGVELNQHVFIAYTYTDNDNNEWVGVGFKNTKPAKSFKDFENNE